MRTLITGITGMAGSHLAEYLLQLGNVEVFGTYRWRSRMDNLQDLASAGKLRFIAEGGNAASCRDLQSCILQQADARTVSLVQADLADPSSMRKVIAAVQPDKIFHLAAQSYVPTSWNAPAETLSLNIVGQVNLLEAVREQDLSPQIHIAGSSEEYGLVYPEEVPIKESNPLRPLSPYAVSKVAQELLAWQYCRSYGMKIVVTRGFNHTGPRRGDVFVTSSFAKQIAEIERGLKPPVLRVGDLTSKRDWTDVRDIVRAYWQSLEKGEPGEVYNVGSGVARTVEEMLEILLGFSTVKVDIKQDASRMRPSDVKILWSDCSKFRTGTGWAPTIPFERTMRDLLDYWRKRV